MQDSKLQFPRVGASLRSEKADSTLRSSQAVPHPSTNRALRRLTSEVGRDPVYSTRYGRQRMQRRMYGPVNHASFTGPQGKPLRGKGRRGSVGKAPRGTGGRDSQTHPCVRAPHMLRRRQAMRVPTAQTKGSSRCHGALAHVHTYRFSVIDFMQIQTGAYLQTYLASVGRRSSSSLS